MECRKNKHITTALQGFTVSQKILIISLKLSLGELPIRSVRKVATKTSYLIIAVIWSL